LSWQMVPHIPSVLLLLLPQPLLPPLLLLLPH
jgi:hypothetical protein